MRFLNLKTNFMDNPLGFSFESIYLTWEVDGCEDTDKKVVVDVSNGENFSEILYSSEIPVTQQGVHIDLDLNPRARYYWRVRLLDESIFAESWFETAKITEEWKAKLIKFPKNITTSILTRKTFEITKEIKSARLYACGLGVYESEINGEKVGNEFLAPGFHSYDFWKQYQTYDVTNMLNVGNNCLGFMIGDGWYKGRFGFDGGYTNLYGDQLQLISELWITYQDGAEECIVTDSDWSWKEGFITFSAIYDGEHIDAREYDENWSTVKSDSETWKKVEITDNFDKSQLCERLSLPVVENERIKPTLLTSEKGELILDFGQNMTGWIEFDAPLNHNQEVRYQVGEILQEGNFYNDNLRTAKSEFVYISDGNARIVRPHFTFYGFRYAKIEGFPTPIDANWFTGVVLHSELVETGSIKTGNELVNKLVKNALWGQKGNFLDVPTDCPQRDERMGWTGDAQIFAKTASYNMLTPAFYNKFLKDVRLEQVALNGSVPFMVPMLKPENDAGFVTGNGAAAWSDVATILPMVMYDQYGDVKLLEQHYDIMRDWVDFVHREDENSGGTRLWKTRFQFGDWLALDGKNSDSPMGGTDVTLVASIYYYYSSKLVAQAAKILNKNEDYKFYENLSLEVKDAIQSEYITEKGRLAVVTQTAYAMCIYFDLIPENVRERVYTDFKNKMLEDGVHLQTGFVGTAYLLPALSKCGLTELAYSILLNEDFPSWLYAVKLGATTVWERWNSVLEDGSISGTGMNSLNHYAYGVVVEWIYEHVLGIKSDRENAGFKHFFINPEPSIQLGRAKGSYCSIQGLVESEWTINDNNTVTVRFVVPFGSRATAVIPRATLNSLKDVVGKEVPTGLEVELESGEYVFTYTPNEKYAVNYSVDMTYEELLHYTPTRQILFEHPAIKGNDLMFGSRNVPFKEFSKLPIISNFITDEYIEAVQERFSKL